MLWLYSKEHERIALLKRASDVHIISTLSDGDKELIFDYRKDGRYRQDIECEGYILTQTDEYVIKDIESGDTSDTVTAKLNLEELEGKTFPEGFKTTFFTFIQCMEVALEGTGWTVKECNVLKRRTIKRDEGANVIDVIKQCISTYKIEIVYDTINKTISAYERIGSDRGRYIMETLNLRKLSVGKNTYDFCTQLYPVGKDGLTIESVNGGKKYVENFTYCSKKKMKTWIDRRYTDPSSLMEDAVYKLEELAKPYATYEADVTDLAKQSEVYKNILDYTLGDTLTLVSKTEAVKEKQRIVKMTEYPKNPEKNTCELSSTRKTFADIQKADTEELSEAVSDVTETAEEQSNDYANQLFETLSDDVEAVRVAVVNLEEKVNGMNTDAQITEINANIKSMTESMTSLTETVSKHEERLTAVEGVVETVKTQSEDIATLKTDMQQVKQDIVDIRAAVVDVTKSVSEIKEAVSQQGTQLDEISKKIDELHPADTETDSGTDSGTEEETEEGGEGDGTETTT